MSNTITTTEYTIADNESLLKAWLRLSTSIINSRLVSTLSYNESLILSLLFSSTKSGLSMTATELCRFTKMLKSQMNRTLNLLEKKKLILRERSSSDKRQILITFNMEQASQYEKQHADILEIVDHVISKLGTQNTKQAITLFSQIADIADEFLN